MSSSIVAIISDTHIGGSTALSPLKFSIHNRNTLEEQAVSANRLQEWLHEKWVDYWAYGQEFYGVTIGHGFRQNSDTKGRPYCSSIRIQAVAFYNTELTPAQVVELTAAMNAL